MLKWKTGRRQATGAYEGVIVDLIKNGFAADVGLGVSSVQFTLQ